jgi:histone-lysine N-methyltransferase SETMAR
MQTDILNHLRDAVRRKSPEKWRTNSWFQLHDSAPALQLVLVKNFLAKNYVTIVEHPPHSPDLATAHFYLFVQLKSPLKGQHFCDAIDIIKNAPEELKKLSQTGFKQCFQHLYSQRQKCIVTQGDYYKGNVTSMIVLFCTSQK